VLDGLCLEPCAGISELVGDDADTVKIGVIVIYLVLWVSPSVTNGDSLKDDTGGFEERVVIEDLGGESWNVVTSERFTSDVKRTLLEGRPLTVKIVDEVQQMICRLSRRIHQGFGLVALVREADVEGLVDEESVPHDVPSLRQLSDAILGDANGPKFSERSKLRAGSRPTLQPQNEGDSLIRYGDAVRVSPKEAVVHSGLSLGVVPVDLLIACINNCLPE